MLMLLENELPLIKILQDCLFLTRPQIEEILGKDTRRTNERLLQLIATKILDRKYRTDTFSNHQSPAYYLGSEGSKMVGMNPKDYKAYRNRILAYKDRAVTHALLLYDIYLCFRKNSEVLLFKPFTDGSYFETLHIKPDGYIRYRVNDVVYECFLEADRNTESRSVLYKKVEQYEKFRPDFKVHFTGQGFRVLIVCLEKRNMILPKGYILTTRENIFVPELLEPQIKEFPVVVEELPEPPAPPKPEMPSNAPSLSEQEWEFKKRIFRYPGMALMGVYGVSVTKMGLDWLKADAIVNMGPGWKIVGLVVLMLIILKAAAYARRSP